VTWGLLIFYLSTGSFGGSLSTQLLKQIIDILHLAVSHETFVALHFLFRKLAHLTEYAIFSLLFYQCFGDAREVGWRTRRAVWSVVGAALYSLTDELHQSIVPGRTASWMDCGVDTAGAALGMLALYGGERLSRARKTKEAASQGNKREEGTGRRQAPV